MITMPMPTQVPDIIACKFIKWIISNKRDIKNRIEVEYIFYISNAVGNANILVPYTQLPYLSAAGHQ